MFRRTSNRQNQNINPDPEIREEQKADATGIGNEALADLIGNNIVNNISNEANNAGSEDQYSHYAENDLKNVIWKPKHKSLTDLNQISQPDNDDIAKNISVDSLIDNEIKNYNSDDADRLDGEEPIPDEISQDRLVSYYLNDLIKNDRESDQKKDKTGKDKSDLPLIQEKDDDPQRIQERKRKNSDDLLIDPGEKVNIKEAPEIEQSDSEDEDLLGQNAPIKRTNQNSWTDSLPDLKNKNRRGRKDNIKDRNANPQKNIMNGDNEDKKSDLSDEEGAREKSGKGASSSKKNRKGKKSSKKSSAPKLIEPEIDEDLTQVDKTLEPVGGLGVVFQKLPERKKPWLVKRIFSWLSYYSGKFVGKVFGGILTALNVVTFGKISGSNTYRGWKNGFGSKRDWQQDRDRSNIPGWDGAKWEEEQEDDNAVNADFRRVPEIWSYPIAAEGAETTGNGANAEQKQRPPIISVYIDQGSKRYTVDSNGETGHTGIGIEYSRRSGRTGRWERYNLRFGFGMTGGLGEKTKMAVLSYNNATIPGGLFNERGHHYTVSRSFTATPKQVNRVLRSAENYGDRGGYNQYNRNCTTFAKEMIVDVAKIKSAESIFKKDTVYLPLKTDAQMFAAGSMAPFAKADMENNFEKIGHKDDLDYENFGSKMATKQEYDRYKKSIKLYSLRNSKTYSPNGSAENMLRTEGGRSGKIGTYTPALVNGSNVNEVLISTAVRKLPGLAGGLKANLQQITPEDKFNDNTLPEFDELMDRLDKDNLEKTLDVIPLDVLDFKNSKKESLISYRTIFTDLINDLNTLLFKYYQNDKRVQKDVLPMINLANHGIKAIDEIYESAASNNRDDDIEMLTNDFSRKTYSFDFSNENDEDRTVRMTPSRYEAWIQICKTPEAALRKYSRYQDLSDQYNGHVKLTKEEMKELNTLNRLNDLAKDFERSHRYMLEKGKFSQQDVDYVFSLEKKERNENVATDMFQQNPIGNDRTMSYMSNPSASASGTYEVLMMKTIFGDMKQNYLNQFSGKKKIKYDKVLEWASKDSGNYIPRKKEETKTILRGIKRSEEHPSDDDVKDRFIELLTKWLFQIYHSLVSRNVYKNIVLTLTGKDSPLMAQIDKLISELDDE